MNATLISLAIALSTVSQGGNIAKKELDYQKEMFQHWWGTELNLKLDDLPLEGKVPGYRIPYSGHDYPDKGGGTLQAMRKYDMAFHRGRPVATEFERRDIGAHRGGRFDDDFYPRRGLFGRIIGPRGPRTPSWYGHCNGWTAAAIRHAEPQKNVVRNGVTFTPADIKGMLADIYMYTDTEFLGGEDPVINPAVFHLSLGNWLGLGSHPVGMEAAVGEVVINYPIYSYGSRVKKLSEDQAEVQLTIRYAMNTPQEYVKSTGDNRTMYFHYALSLNDEGEINGGRYYGDSARIDMLWAPLKPVQGGKKGNERGNPYLDVNEVLAIWRESVPEDLRGKWLNIDPTDEDRILSDEEKAELAAERAAASAAPEAATVSADGPSPPRATPVSPPSDE